MDKQIQDAVTKAITESNDKTVEIRPAKKSKRRRKFPLMLLFGGALALIYWLRKSQKPTEKLESAASKTADQTKNVTERAAETIQEAGETLAEEIEEGSQKVSEQLQQKGENTAEKTEEAGETMAEDIKEESQKAGEQLQQKGESAAEKTEEAGEKASSKVDESADSSSDSSSDS